VTFTNVCRVVVSAARFCGSFSTSSTDCASAGVTFAAAGGGADAGGAGTAGDWALAEAAANKNTQNSIRRMRRRLHHPSAPDVNSAARGCIAHAAVLCAST